MARKQKSSPSSASASPSEAVTTGSGATSTANSPWALTGLKILVFGAGGVLMGLEIAGSRVLAPHFGNSVFVWGSLIAIFLMAISVGNYLGGRLADQNPSHLMLNTICIGVSIWIFGIAVFAHAVCQVLVQAGFGEQSGPLGASLLLFLAPSIGMGMVSPFAIRLAASSLETVGKISGSLYALSNVGSIVGTMVTTFVLIPFVGLAVILKGLGLVLLVVAIATVPGIVSRRHAPRLAALAVVTGLLLWLPVSAPSQLARGERIVVEVSTPYHNIAVVDNPYDNYRSLKFDGYTETAISLTPPYEALADYTDYFHLAFLVQPQIDHALFIGAGGAVGPRAFHMHHPDMRIDVIDIDPQVLELARSHFYLEDDPRIRTIARDGRIFVREAQDQYDAIILDAFTIGGRIPFHLVTREFFALCASRMADDGVFIMNINSALEGPQSGIFQSTYRTLGEAFPQVYVFAKRYALRDAPEQSTNILLLATRSEERWTLDDWRMFAAAHESASYVGHERLLRLVEDLVEILPDVSRAPLFTDDFAPIETMSF
jgi:spermidine synthase